jgi:monothiol glutaredoxin
MMSRAVFEGRYGDRATKSLHSNHAQTITEVAQAVDRDAVVVVGMAQNPHVGRVRAALTAASYFSQWKPRLAIKMWSGWPTFPQVFVNGTLIGGNADTRAAIEDGSLKALLDAGR